MAIRSKDLEKTPDQVAALKAREGAIATTAIVDSIKAKTWDQLTAAEKDDVMKAIAIRLGIVSPDPAMVPRALEAESRLAAAGADPVPAPVRTTRSR